MRVRQIQRLVWSADALALAGVLAAGAQLWCVQTRAPREHVVWQQSDAGASRPPKEDPEQLIVIYETEVNGWKRRPKEPPPPALDPIAEFRKRAKYLGALDLPGRGELSIAHVSFDGKPLALVPGDDVGGFQLVEIAVDPEAGQPRFVFRQCTTGDAVSIGPPPKTVQPLTRGGAEPLCRTFSDGVAEGAIAEYGPLRGHAFRDAASGEWVIPEDERRWLEAFGRKVLGNLATKPDAGADGVSHGLRILGNLESGTPLAASHGLEVNDVIRSIDGVAITSREDIVRYLRGVGRTLSRYEVEVDRAGSAVSVVYRVPRRLR